MMIDESAMCELKLSSIIQAMEYLNWNVKAIRRMGM